MAPKNYFDSDYDKYGNFLIWRLYRYTHTFLAVPNTSLSNLTAVVNNSESLIGNGNILQYSPLWSTLRPNCNGNLLSIFQQTMLLISVGERWNSQNKHSVKIQVIYFSVYISCIIAKYASLMEKNNCTTFYNQKVLF